MLAGGSFEDFEDTHARMRDLQASLAQILGFHAFLLTVCGGGPGANVKAAGAGLRRIRDALTRTNSGVVYHPALSAFPVTGMTKASRAFALIASGCMLAACSPVYKLDIQQGNLFSKSLVDSLKPGMSKRQVTLVMGSPSVVSPFEQSRWDYISTIRRGNGRMESKDLVLYFEKDSLARIEGDYFAENPQDLIKEATKYKRQYPDEKRPKDDKKGQGGGA
jgi:outer membrane protein assembly factor BamE